MRAFLLIPALALALSAQTAPEKPKIGIPAPANQGPIPPHLTAPKEETIPADQVIARLGKRIIREKDFLEWMKITSGKRFEMVAKLPGGLSRSRQQYLDIQMLAAKARKARLQESADFKKILAIQEDQALVGFMMSEDREGGEGQRLKQKAENPSEEQLKAFFEKNAQRYETAEKFTARHILVGLKGAPRMGDKGLTEEEAKARIAKLKDELKAGKSFESLAKEYSDDPGNKANGGLYKDAIYGSFVQEFQDAVRRQEVGKVGEPVKTLYGYHLILVEGRTPKQPGEFDKVKDRVKQQWTSEQRDSLRKAFLEETRKEMDFVSGPEAAEKGRR
jgi:parvulin-like peptidyl-prolyl isomerase